MSLRVLVVVVLSLLSLASPVVAKKAAAPSIDPADAAVLDDLIARAREHGERSREAILGYSFTQHEVVEVKNKKGKIVDESDRLIRVVPTSWGAETALLEVDGKPPTEKQVAKHDKRNRKRREAGLKRERKESRSDEEESAEDDGVGALLELLGRTDYEFVGREVEGDRELLGIAFDPSIVKGEEKVTRKLLASTRGTVWLDSETGEPVRLEAGSANKFRLKGVVGVKHFALSVEQVRVREELWLPKKVTFEGHATFLGIGRKIRSVVTFSEYRKASTSDDVIRVETAEQELERILDE